MLWPIVQPFQATCVILLALVLSSTAIALLLKANAGRVFWICSGLAVIGFIPSCVGIMNYMDKYRFGTFFYPAYDDVQDLRIYRYLPPAATNITIEKKNMGYRAKYTISEQELREYIETLWKKQTEAIETHSSDQNEAEDKETAKVNPEQIQLYFEDLKWPAMANAISLGSPTYANGAGSEYFFDRDTGIVYQRAGYW